MGGVLPGWAGFNAQPELMYFIGSDYCYGLGRGYVGPLIVAAEALLGAGEGCVING